MQSNTAQPSLSPSKLRPSVPNGRKGKLPQPRIGVDWSIAGPLLVAHGIAFAAPFTYSTSGIVVFGIAYLLTGLGVTAGAHRLFTHATFQARKGLQRVLAVLFLLSAQGSLLRWVRDHHIHHAHSDREGDPHTPHLHHGFWYAQVGWLWKKPPTHQENKELYQRFGGNGHQDRFLRKISTPMIMVFIHLSLIVLLFAGGCFWENPINPISGVSTGISWVVWGVFLRIICVLHATSLVNSVAHLWGYRTYATQEESRNHWFVALVSLGEGWHNNHHSRPGAANQGFHRWWEFDLTFCFLWLAGKLGLLYNMRVSFGDKPTLWFPRLPQKHSSGS